MPKNHKKSRLLSFIFKNMRKIILMLVLGIGFISCDKQMEDSIITKSASEEANLKVAAVTATVPTVYKKIYKATSITSDGTYVTIKTQGIPDHESVYYSATNALYKTFSGTTFGGNTFKKNPNTIATMSYTFKIPIYPKVATNHAATPMGVMGVSLNGVPFYNQYAGVNTPLTSEIASFDKYYGHPDAKGAYHYHVEPLYLTTIKSTKSGLMGFLLDGFPVYGPNEESGTVVSNSNLDVYHGHTHATVDYPSGIYHYHFTSTSPYLNGNGFYGTAGTITQ
jgi:YHYH protein